MSLASGGAALAAAGRCLSGGLSGCLLPVTGLGSLGLLLLLFLLFAGASQSMASAFVGFAPQRPHSYHGNYYSSSAHYNHVLHTVPQHNYQLAVFGPGLGSGWHHRPSSTSPPYQPAYTQHTVPAPVPPAPTYSTGHSPATTLSQHLTPVHQPPPPPYTSPATTLSQHLTSVHQPPPPPYTSPATTLSQHLTPVHQPLPPYTSPATLVAEHLTPPTLVGVSSSEPTVVTHPAPAPRNRSYTGGGGGGGGVADPHVIVPALSLHYGVPDSDILSAQASVSAAAQRLPDVAAPSPRPGKPYTLDGKLQKTDRLELDVIPAKGTDYPEDGCARDQVRMPEPPEHAGHGGYRSWKRWNPCQPLLEQGDCPDNHWVIIDKYSRTGVCARRLCPDGYVFLEEDGLCHDGAETTSCPGNRRLFLTAFGEHSCGCGDGEYLDVHGVCRTVYSSDTCPYSQQLRFNQLFQLQCEPAACPRDKPVNFHGWCKAFGDACGDYKFTLGFDTTRLEPKCYPAEELGVGSASSHPPAEAVSAAPATTTTESPAAEVPHLSDGYLPPPGQLTQYSSRRGIWDSGWVERGRSTLAQWLGFGRRRGAPTRRRRPPAPPPPPQQQHQQPLLDPWSRLDIDQVTFVDSERVSSAELALQRRRGHHHRRYRRQIFSKVPLLNACRPGARSGFNFKCRDKVLPGSLVRKARSPIPPTNAPACAPGERLDAAGQCRRSVSGLGK